MTFREGHLLHAALPVSIPRNASRKGQISNWPEMYVSYSTASSSRLSASCRPKSVQLCS